MTRLPWFLLPLLLAAEVIQSIDTTVSRSSDIWLLEE